MIISNIKNKRIKTPIKRGFSLFELLLGVIVSMSMYSNYAKLQADYQANIRAKSIANTMQVMNDAASVWGKTYSVQLLGANGLSDNQVVEVPFSGLNGPVSGTSSLMQAGLIPFNYSPNLPYGQKLAVLAKRVPATNNIPTHIEIMTMTKGGTDYTDNLLGKITSSLGGNGGAILRQQFGNAQANQINGAYGTWNANISDWDAGTSKPATGHVVMKNSALNGGLTEFMDRFNISNPEANRMHTNLIDNNNKLNAVSIVDGVPGQDLYISSQASNNNVVMPKNLIVCQQNQQGCGITMGQDAYLENMRNGWTTLYQDKRGMKIYGESGANAEVDGGIYLPTSMGDEDSSGTGANSHRVTGVLFSYNDADSFGAHLYQDNPQFLTLSGANGFLGINIQSENEQQASLQLLNAKFFSTSSGLLSLQTPTTGMIAIQHQDGSLADISENAINLGTSSSINPDGKTYPAFKGGSCLPNGRIASSLDGSGHLMNCINGLWYDVSDPYSNLAYKGYFSGYNGNQSNSTQIVELTGHRGSGKKGNPEFWISVNGRLVCVDRYDTSGSNGNLFSSTVQYVTGTYTCTIPVPPHGVISGADGGDFIYVYGLGY